MKKPAHHLIVDVPRKRTKVYPVLSTDRLKMTLFTRCDDAAFR
jgi:hypothetical protein